MPRKLRIAVSVFFGLLTAALCVLWVRSYWQLDSALWGSGFIFDISSYGGRLSFTAYSADVDYGVYLRTQPLWDSFYTDRPDATTLGFLFDVSRADQYIRVIVPNYFSSLVVGFVAVAPWLPLSFSLRTMLLATTLVAFVLGLAVWAAR